LLSEFCFFPPPPFSPPSPTFPFFSPPPPQALEDRPQSAAANYLSSFPSFFPFEVPLFFSPSRYTFVHQVSAVNTILHLISPEPVPFFFLPFLYCDPSFFHPLSFPFLQRILLKREKKSLLFRLRLFTPLLYLPSLLFFSPFSPLSFFPFSNCRRSYEDLTWKIDRKI